MIDPDTFLTTLYVMADDFCKCQLVPARVPGPRASLTQSEVITLALFGQWERFGSERDFYRYASQHLRGHGRLLPSPGRAVAGPPLPLRSPGQYRVPTRDAKASRGWLAGQPGRCGLEQSPGLV